MLAIVEYALLVGAFYLAALVGAFYLAAWIRFFGNEQLQRLAFGDVLQRALVFASVLVVSMTAFGMYVMHSREGLNGHAVRAIAASIAGGSVLIVAQYVMPLSTIGRGVLALALGIGHFDLARHPPAGAAGRAAATQGPGARHGRARGTDPCPHAASQ